MYADKPWYLNGDGDYIYDTRFHYGEWNEPLPPAPEVIELFAKGGTAADFVTHMAKYGKPEVATAYTKRSCDNLAEMALGQVMGFILPLLQVVAVMFAQIGACSMIKQVSNEVMGVR